MATKLTRLAMFLASYLPLGIVISILYWDSAHILGLVILLVCVIGSLFMYWFIREAGRIAPIVLHVEELQRKDSDAIAYIVTYMVPFLALPAEGWQKWTALLIFFGVLGILYVQSDMIHINPLLNLSGYFIYEAKLSSGERVAVLSKRAFLVTGDMLAGSLAATIYMEREKVENGRRRGNS